MIPTPVQPPSPIPHKHLQARSPGRKITSDDHAHTTLPKIAHASACDANPCTIHTNCLRCSIWTPHCNGCATGAILLNQAVLLRGVNDSVDALAWLSERGFQAGGPTLHQLDRVAGSAHFEVDDRRALAMHTALTARLSGYLVSRLVREVAGDPGKRALSVHTSHFVPESAQMPALSGIMIEQQA